MAVARVMSYAYAGFNWRLGSSGSSRPAIDTRKCNFKLALVLKLAVARFIFKLGLRRSLKDLLRRNAARKLLEMIFSR